MKLKTVSFYHSPNNPIYMFQAKHFNRMRSTFTALITLLIASIALAQTPVNDICSGAITLTPIATGGICPTTVYTNVGANDATGSANSPNASCFNGARSFKDVWFKFRTEVGTNVNYRITIKGTAVADSIKNPQVALYVGDCTVGLFEEYCATKEVTYETNTVSIDAGCMRSGTDYYIQVGNFLSSDVGGTFTVCVERIDAIYRMRAQTQTTTACIGTLYDSGGPDANYGNNENRWEFNIRPQATGCMEITIDSFSTEANIDTLIIYDGRTNQILDRISGSTGRPITFQARTDWVKVYFRSDGSLVARGFKLTWRALLTCNSPQPTSCASPEIVPTLPFSRFAVTTCNDNLNAVTSSRCTTPATVNNFLQGKDHVYKFTSAGAQCIRVILTGLPPASGTGTSTGFGVGVYYGCPNDATSGCVANGRANTARDSVVILNTTLELAGDYYIVVSGREACSNYNIQIDTVPCLNRLPNAGFCGRALTLNDCSNSSPSDIVLDLTARGDSTFMSFGTPRSINAGCIAGFGGVGRFNFVFMYFKANADGKFAFSVGPTINNPTSDIDFNVYGPIGSFDSICNYTRNTAPIRSSFAVETSVPGRRTGLAASFINNAGTRVTVNDTYDCNGVNDGFVTPIDVIKDKYYVIWLNDFNGGIGRDGVRLDFGGTTNGVLNNNPADIFAAGRDTALCAGGSTTMTASGGISYKWSPSAGLNRDTGAVVVATPTQSTAYNVVIQGTCRIAPKIVNVRVFNVKDMPNQTVCRSEQIVLNAGEVYPANLNAVWSWTSSTNHLAELSCTNCPTPVLTATNTTGATEIHRFTARLTTPSCTISKTVEITVTNGVVANYRVVTDLKATRDTNVCTGSTVNLLRVGFDPTAVYTWASTPPSVLTGQNPAVAPTTGSVKYYVTVTGGAGGCVSPSYDSVIVNVFQPPVLNLTTRNINTCRDAQFILGRTAVQANTTYSWRNITDNNTFGIANPSDPNSAFTLPPTYGTTRLYVLTATNLGGCTVKDTIIVNGVDLVMEIDTPNVDSIRICRGTPLRLNANAVLTGTKLPVKWDSNRDFSLANDSAKFIVVSPTRRSKYYATISSGTCTRRDSIEVFVDSLPTPRDILPKDTTVCQGTLVILRSPVYEPVFFPGLVVKWTNPRGGLTPDSLYNLVISADTTHTYRRIARNGVCVVTDTVKVNVNKIPTIRIVPADTAICGSGSVTLTALTNDLNVTDWKWKGPNGDIPTGTNPRVVVVIPTGTSNTYTVTAKIGDCPGSATSRITVNPVPTITFPVPPVVCAGGSITLNTSPNSNFTYLWSGSGITNTTASAPNVSPTADTEYSVTVTNPSTRCTTSQKVTIRVATGNLPAIAPLTTCVQKPATLSANGTNNIDGGRYLWTPTNSTTKDLSITPGTPGTVNYTVTYTFGPNCTLTQSTSITAVANFTLAITPSITGLVDQGTPLTFTAATTGNLVGGTYAWTSTGTTPDNTTGATVNIRPMVNSDLNVIVKSTTGCENTATTKLNIRFPNYSIPNAFTPNGDTLNGNFNVIFVGNRIDSLNPNPQFWKGRIEVLSFKVYNRIGQVVYSEESTATLNATTYKGWDGKKNGNELPSDVYVYAIKLKMPDDAIKIETGELNLIR